jgi:hypothetical protein
MSLRSAASAAAARKAILILYKNCLKSAVRIPDPSQRSMYMQYTRQGFRDKATSVVPSSKEATRAIRDAEEQVERMNYYHSVREMKERGEEFPVAADPAAGTGGNKDSSTVSPVNLTSPQHQVESTESDVSLRTEKQIVVKAWLLTPLPELHPDDLATYTLRLLEDGFDSLYLLNTELMYEDLDFMKKAHKRAIVRAYGIKL